MRLQPPDSVRALQRKLYGKAKSEPHYLRRKHQHRTRAYQALPHEVLYGRLGLYRLPMRAPWVAPAHALR